MGTRAPRVGDNIEILREGTSNAEVSEGDILEVVGLSTSSIIVKDDDNQVYTLDRHVEGRGWENLSVTESSVDPLGVQGMKKKAFNVLILQHKPVPGIPETTADIETTSVFGPETVLAVSDSSARSLATRKLAETVNIEYIEVICREF